MTQQAHAGGVFAVVNTAVPASRLGSGMWLASQSCPHARPIVVGTHR